MLNTRQPKQELWSLTESMSLNRREISAAWAFLSLKDGLGISSISKTLSDHWLKLTYSLSLFSTDHPQVSQSASLRSRRRGKFHLHEKSQLLHYRTTCFQPKMNIVTLRSNQEKINKLILSAELAKFAYTSANPTSATSVVDNLAATQLQTLLSTQPGQTPQPGPNGCVGHFARFASYSWWRSEKTQFRWFRSQSYIYDYVDQGGVHKIVVAFRGTWNDDSITRKWYKTSGKSAITLSASLSESQHATSVSSALPFST
jgi:hypothetical protein